MIGFILGFLVIGVAILVFIFRYSISGITPGFYTQIGQTACINGSRQTFMECQPHKNSVCVKNGIPTLNTISTIENC